MIGEGDLSEGYTIDFVTGVPMTMPTAPTAVPGPSYNFAENKLPVHVDLTNLFSYIDGRFEMMQESIDTVNNEVESVKNDVDEKMTSLQESIDSISEVGTSMFL